VPEALCPLCGAGLRYHTGRRLACATFPACPWEVGLTPQEHLDIAWYLTAPGMLDKPIQLFVAEIARRVTIIPRPPAQTLVAYKPRPHTHKLRIVPAGPEDPRTALERKADQFDLNEGRLTKQGHCLLATSQEVDATGQPVDVYQLCPQRDGTWTCTCPARCFCAHLAGYWRRLCRKQAEGQGDQAQIAHIIAALERQAGIFTVTGKGKPATQVATEGQAAGDLLYG
jgi:hypothetical protein